MFKDEYFCFKKQAKCFLNAPSVKALKNRDKNYLNPILSPQKSI
jgi:hypothetical protein